jgi:hypothetical protein
MSEPLFDFDDFDEIDRIIAEGEAEETCPEGTPKYTESEAGYLELPGAVKDGDCKIVYVEGGISKDLGCCNGVRPVKGAKAFKCGLCEFLSDE